MKAFLLAAAVLVCTVCLCGCADDPQTYPKPQPTNGTACGPCGGTGMRFDAALKLVMPCIFCGGDGIK